MAGFSSYFGGLADYGGPLCSNSLHLIALKQGGGPVKKTFVVTRNIVGVAGLLLAGYVLVTSLPDLGRYIKISRM